MQIDIDGIPVISQQGDQQRWDAFLDRLAPELYGRLPRFARFFLSEDVLRTLLALCTKAIIARIPH